MNQDVPFSRLMALAQHERDRRGLRGRLADGELLGLMADVYVYCRRKFDPDHPPNSGVCRRGGQDRFVYYFMRKLGWELEDYRRRVRRTRPVGDASSYRGRRDEHGYCLDDVRQPRSKTALLQLVQRALAYLDERERALVDLYYWEEVPLTAITTRLGFTSRFQARRELDRVHAKVRALVLAEMEAAVLGPEDDPGLLEAA